MDSKTKQLYAEPGPGRIPLGTFQRVGEESAEEKLQKEAAAKEEVQKEVKRQMDEELKKQAKVDTKGKLEWSSPDGDFTWRLGGRLHLDGTFYDNSGGSAEKSGVDVRRARVELQGTLYDHWMWKLDYEFGQTKEIQAGFRDAYVRYLFKDYIPNFPTYITVGQFKEYLGLESMNSSNHMPFVERAGVSRTFHDFAEASDGRRLGVGVQTAGNDLWTAAFGVFGKNTSGDSGDGFTDPVAIEGRATLSPIHTKYTAVHLGFAGNSIDLAGTDPDNVQFTARPDARIGAQTFLNTGVLENAEDVLRLGVEFGAIYGPVWLQSEYLQANVHRTIEDTLTFEGWHVDVGWVLTGESRVYDWHAGVFQNPKPHANFTLGGDGWGALEWAARYDVVDFNDLDIQGGRETNFTTGLHWFVNPVFAFKLDWTKVIAVSGGQFDGVDPNEFLLRAQAFW